MGKKVSVGLDSTVPSAMVVAQPKVRIYHVISLIVVAAILFVIERHYLDDRILASVRGVRAIGLASTALSSILSSIAITVVLFESSSSNSRHRFYCQPGHWLLLEIAATSLLWILQLSLYWVGDVYTSITILAAMQPGGFWIRSVLALSLNIYIGVQCCEEQRWKWVFYFKGLAAVVQSIGAMFVLLQMIYAAMIDRRVSRARYIPADLSAPASVGLHRDSMHWCGVIVQFAYCVVTTFTFVATAVVIAKAFLKF